MDPKNKIAAVHLSTTGETLFPAIKNAGVPDDWRQIIRLPRGVNNFFKDRKIALCINSCAVVITGVFRLN
jgi:predicted sugar kinase